jgi:hypothetical protein
MRFPTIDVDYWALVSGEARHASAPESFLIPSIEQRSMLQRGDGAKLIFEIESEDEDGQISRDCERMWVVVSEVTTDSIIGRLTNTPIGTAIDSAFYLGLDVEIPFLPEHVIEIGHPHKEYLAALFSEGPKKSWPR